MQPIKLLDLGTEGASKNERYKIRLINLLAFISISTSTVYLSYYLFIKAMLPVLINVAAIIFYIATFSLTKNKCFYSAKLWIISVFLLHLFVLTTFVFTKKTGFHYFYFSVPPIVFLIFEYNKTIEKLGLSLAAFVLFYICELFVFHPPYIPLPDTINRLFYLTSMLILFIGISTVIFLFARDNKEKENEQERLINMLQNNLKEIKTLKGFLPICASCKKIRDDKGYWNQIESYIQAHSEAEFSHSICPECTKELYPDLYDDE